MKAVCISDTHLKHKELDGLLPSGDILIHAGDFTNFGSPQEILSFLDWFESQKQFKYKLLIAGNHEVCLENDGDQAFRNWDSLELRKARRRIFNPKGFYYLHHQSISLDGLTFFGSPFVFDETSNSRWAFATNEAKAEQVWSQVPNNTDVLITHGPPLGIFDEAIGGQHIGCPVLLKEVKERIKPRFHIFGHCHGNQGVRKDTESGVTFVNVANAGSKPNFSFHPRRPRSMLEPIVLNLK